MANRKRRPSGNPTRTPPAGSTGRAGARGSASGRTGSSAKAGSSSGDASPLRTWVADHSRGAVLMLSRQPKYLLPALIVVLVLVGLLTIPPIGAAALVIVGLFVGWLAFLSWPLLQPTQRTLRLVILALLFAAAAARAAGAL